MRREQRKLAACATSARVVKSARKPQAASKATCEASDASWQLALQVHYFQLRFKADKIFGDESAMAFVSGRFGAQQASAFSGDQGAPFVFGRALGHKRPEGAFHHRPVSG